MDNSDEYNEASNHFISFDIMVDDIEEDWTNVNEALKEVVNRLHEYGVLRQKCVDAKVGYFEQYDSEGNKCSDKFGVSMDFSNKEKE